MLIDSRSPHLEEERHMKKLPSETEEPLGSTEAGGYVVLHTWKSDYDKNQRIHQDQDQVKEIFSLQERKKNVSMKSVAEGLK
ncbi:hypothetical protein YC2023_099681 [Brassica napus]